MSGHRYMVVAVALAAMAVFAWAWSRPGEEAPRVVALTNPVPSESLAATEPGIVRIVALPESGQVGEEPDLGSARPIVDVHHLGPLGSADSAALKASCERYFAMQQQRFAARKEAAAESKELLEEARLFYAVELARAAMRAVDQGSYLVLAQSDPMQLTLPGAELLTTGAMRGDQQVNVSIVMSLQAHPELRAARDYLDQMQYFDDSEKARRFNELPDQERVGLAARIRELQRKANRSRAEDDFLQETLGFNTRLDANGNLLFAFPVK